MPRPWLIAQRARRSAMGGQYARCNLGLLHHSPGRLCLRRRSELAAALCRRARAGSRAPAIGRRRATWASWPKSLGQPEQRAHLFRRSFDGDGARSGRPAKFEGHIPEATSACCTRTNRAFGPSRHLPGGPAKTGCCASVVRPHQPRASCCALVPKPKQLAGSEPDAAARRWRRALARGVALEERRGRRMNSEFGQRAVEGRIDDLFSGATQTASCTTRQLTASGCSLVVRVSVVACDGGRA